MNKIVTSVLISSLVLSSVAKADSDDAWWAIGGVILGSALANRNHEEKERQPPPPPPPPEQSYVYPPYKQSRLIPIFKTVCEYTQEYDVWGNPTRRVRTCHEEIAGYREVRN